MKGSRAQHGSDERAGGSRAHSLHIATLFAFAVAQPLFDLAGRHPEFLVAHGMQTASLLIFVFSLAFAFPLSVWVSLLVYGKLSRSLENWLAGLLIGLLSGLLALQVFTKTISAPGPLLVTEAVGVAIATIWLYGNFPGVRLFLTILSPSILIFPLMFLFGSPLMSRDSGPYAMPTVDSQTPIVMVVFDELPLISLLNLERKIDPVRYPNLAALTGESHWFRNATTVSGGTLISLPVILDGLFPDPGRKKLPTISGHPRSLFTLLQNSHELNIHENITQLAPGARSPRNLPPSSFLQDLSIVYLHLLLPIDLAGSLPPITESWRDFAKSSGGQPPGWADFRVDWSDRANKFRDFIQSIRPGGRPGIHFLHSMLPHASWKYLPDGRLYTAYERPGVAGVVGRNDEGIDVNQWLEDEWPIVQAYQRHLLQVSFADRLFGELVAHLKKHDLYDQSLLVVTSDHGAAFRAGDSHRRPTSTNYPAILSIPLLVKEPHQKAAQISDRNVETVDILPTILDVLDIESPWKLDGISALSDRPERPQKIALSDTGQKFTFDARLSARDEFLQRQLDLFGSGDWSAVFEVGPYPRLVGTRLEDLRIRQSRPGDPLVSVEGRKSFENVDLNDTFLPCLVRGRIEPGGTLAKPVQLAISVNGVIRATTRTSPVVDENRLFTALVEPAAFQHGSNRVDLLFIDGNQESPILRHTEKLTVPRALVTTEEGKEFLVVEGGARVPVQPEVILGWVVGRETETPGRYFVGGWVVDRQSQVLVSSVIAVLNGEAVASGPSQFDRVEPVKMFDKPELLKSGFHLEFGLPEDVPPWSVTVRVLAISPSGIAGELNYPKQLKYWPFSPESLGTIPPYPWGETLTFGQEGRALPYLLEGWTAPSVGMIWSKGTAASMHFQVREVTSPVVLEAFFKPFLAPPHLDAQQVEVYLNDQPVGEWLASEDTFQTYRLEIPQVAFRESGEALLEFRTPDAASPASLGRGADRRILGLAMMWVRLSPAGTD